MKFLFVSAFIYPGGYHTLGEGICLELANRGHDVTVLGIGFGGREYDYPFSLNPTERIYVPEHAVKLAKLVEPDWVVFLDDIPKQLAILRNMKKNYPDFFNYRIVSLFPVESKPLCNDWRTGLQELAAIRCTFSQFGVDVCKEANLRVHRLPVALNDDAYKPARQQPNIDKPYILCVAANQLRKNIPATMAVAAKAIEVRKKMGDTLYLVLITDPEAGADGWNLKELPFQCGLDPEDLVIIDRDGVSPAALKSFYANAAALLSTTIAEGIGLPLYEAQAQGCPVVATNCCAVPEAVVEGALINVHAETPYPWGNTLHFWPSVEDGVRKLLEVLDRPRRAVTFGTYSEMVEKLLVLLHLFDGASKNVKEKDDKQPQDIGQAPIETNVSEYVGAEGR